MIPVKKLVQMVMAHEGNYDSVNRNSDGSGASIGIFQWPQRTGGLGLVLKAYHQASPEHFRRIFPFPDELVAHTSSRSMEPLRGKNLWEEPWVSRFVEAGRIPLFQAVQDRLAEKGEFIQAAQKVAIILGFVTERSLAMGLDCAVSQGSGSAVKFAQRTAKALAGQVMPMRDVLGTFITLSTAHFRTTAPTPPATRPPFRWVQVGNEWHKYSGQVDLYRNVVQRRMNLIRHAQLADNHLPTDMATV